MVRDATMSLDMRVLRGPNPGQFTLGGLSFFKVLSLLAYENGDDDEQNPYSIMFCFQDCSCTAARKSIG